MTNHEAKIILRSYRLQGQDAKDPVFAEALEQLRKDPELARWYAEEVRLHSAIAQKIQSALDAPRELREMLLASTRVVTPRTSIWRSPWFAAAASLLLAAVLAIFYISKPRNGGIQTADIAELNQHIAAFLQGDQKEWLSYEATTFIKVKEWLSQNGDGREIVLPARLQKTPTMGCNVLVWNSVEVTFVCFQLENGQLAHLFVVSRDDLKDPPGAGESRFAAIGGLSTAAWTQNDRVYLLAAHMTGAELEKLI